MTATAFLFPPLFVAASRSEGQTRSFILTVRSLTIVKASKTTRMVSRKALFISAATVVAVSAMAYAGWRAMTGSMYVPGEVRKLTLTAATPVGNDKWQVESDILLHHFSVGHGKRNILVLHGGPAAPPKEAWPVFANDFPADEFTVHFYDQRGSGFSTAPIKELDTNAGFMANAELLNSKLGLSRHLQDIERIRKLLNGDAPIDIVGHSFGAFIASLYAAEFPRNVATLSLLCPAGLLLFPPPNDGLMGGIAAMLPPSEKAEYLDWLKKSYFQFSFAATEAELSEKNAALRKWWMRATALKQPESSIKVIMESVDVKSHPAAGWGGQGLFFSMGLHHDYRPALREAKPLIPTVVVHGDDDLQSVSVSEEYVTLFPSSTLVRIKDCGHFPMAEQPAELRRALLSVLRGTNEQ